MAPLVDQKALDDFIGSADLGDARRAEAALEAMAASVRLRIVVETQPTSPVLAPVVSRDR